MLIRVVIVLLVVLNLGAGVWWALRPPPREVAVEARVPGIALLKLGREPAVSPADGDTAPRAAQPAAVLPDAVPDVAFAPVTCASFGPFATAALAETALARIAGPTVRASTRTAAAAGRGWRVVIPPVADAGQAAAVARRIQAAGFTDYFVMREGADANAIALGRYGGETAARARAQALVEAGFDARAEPVGAATHWLDVGVAGDVQMSQLLALSGATRQQPIECATLPATAAG